MASCTARFLKVHVEKPSIIVSGRTQSYRTVLTVIEAININANIFVYRKLPADPEGNLASEFTNVASAVDMRDWPIGYDANNPEVFYRLDSLDLNYRNMDLLDDGLAGIQQDITALLQALCDEESHVDEDWEFGVRPSSSSSGSSGSSVPSSSGTP